MNFVAYTHLKSSCLAFSDRVESDRKYGFPTRSIMSRRLISRAPIIFAFACFLMGGTIVPIVAFGQTQFPIQAPTSQLVEKGALVRLPGNTHPLAEPRYDHDVAPADLPATRMMLVLKRTPQQESSLQSYLQAVQDTNSPYYKKFLTPEEFGMRFGISDASLSIVRGWLQKQGFAVDKVNKGRTAVEFSGTVGQLQQAFHTTIHRYVIRGVEHLANVSDPEIPAALAQMVGGVANLNDFKPHPGVVRGPEGRWNPKQHRFAPELTITNSGNPYLYVGPGDAATIYDAPDSFNTRFASSQTPYDGTGVTIGVVGNTDVNFTDIANYRTLFGLPAGQFTIVFDGNEDLLSQSEDQTEALLDSEVSGALAPGADVVLYTASDTQFQPGIFLAIYRAIDDNKVNILSLSYGECEASLGAAGNLQILNAWEQAAAQGITVTVSSGDSGSAGCDDMNTETVATQGLAVNGLASTPYNIAVGGTDFDVLSKSFSTYVSSSNGSNYTSALSYIPEAPWNNSTSENGLLSANSAYTSGSGKTDIVAGGGGKSSLGLDGQNGYPKPLWQQSYAPSDTDSVRDLPDVSLLAANGQYGALWAICGDNECPGSNATISGVGGTSASTPAFAGILALVNQKVGASTRMGQANWVLYKLAQSHPSAFHSITVGNNSVYCSAQSPNCGANSFLSGYNAGAGYNLSTGLGSVDISTLANDWNSDSFTPTTSTLSLDKTSFVHGTSVNISASVNPSAATGNVAIVNNYASQASASTSASPTLLTLSGGSASGSYAEFPGGTYNVYANYGGDGSYAGSVSQPVQVNVSPEGTTLQFSVDTLNSSSKLVSVAGTSVPLGTFITLNAQPVGSSQAGNPNPVTNATGNITFYDSLNGAGSIGLGSVPLDTSGNAEVNSSELSAGTHLISATYSGDLSYGSSSSPNINFSVSQTATTVSVMSSVTSLFAGDFALSAQISSTAANSFSPTGTVTFEDTTNHTTLGSAPPSGGAAIEVYVSQLAMGANSLVATYSGDSNFIGSGPSAPVTVTCEAGCSNGSGQTIQLSFGQLTGGNISPGGVITAVVSADPGGGFAGAVNMTCSIAGKNSGDQHIPTCTFSPAQVAVINSTQAAQSTLTINTTAATSGALRNPMGSPWFVSGSTTLATMLLLGISAKRFRRRYLLGIAIAMLAIGGAIGCGGGGVPGSGSSGGEGGGGGGTPGTTPDTYTVTFRAADAATGAVTAEDYFSFTVN
jgi:hypothetical protein